MNKIRNLLKITFTVILFCNVLFAPQLFASDTLQTLNVAIPKSFPPQYQLDKSNKPTGFAIDVFNEIAKQANFNINYQVKDNWPEVFNALKKVKLMLSLILAYLKNVKIILTIPHRLKRSLFQFLFVSQRKTYLL